MRLVVVSFVGLLATACTPSPEQKSDDVCTAFCDCTSASPAKVDACVPQCADALPTVTDTCLECVYTNSQTCTALFDDCFNNCFHSNPPPGGN